MGTHHISALEEFCHDQAGITPDDSARWLFIHMLDELTTGRLAFRTLSGHLRDLDDILDHHFWVFGIMRFEETGETQAFFRPFSPHADTVTPPIRRLLKRAIASHRSHPSEAERAGDILELFEHRTIAALSVGDGSDGDLCTVLYWHPFFTADIAVGLLQETVRMDSVF